MPCKKCEHLLFQFTEELGEFSNINLLFMEQLAQEKDEDDITEAGFQLLNARLSQGAVLFDLIKQISRAALDGHEDIDDDGQLDLFGTPRPMMS